MAAVGLGQMVAPRWEGGLMLDGSGRAGPDGGAALGRGAAFRLSSTGFLCTECDSISMRNQHSANGGGHTHTHTHTHTYTQCEQSQSRTQLQCAGTTNQAHAS